MGAPCFQQSPQKIPVGGDVQVEATFGKHYPPFRKDFVRLEDKVERVCAHPKERPPICGNLSWMKFILPGEGPENLKEIFLSLPTLSHGLTWGVFELEK